MQCAICVVASFHATSMTPDGGFTSGRNGGSKLLANIRSALAACDVRDGAMLSFHHHLRNGDHVMNLVLTEAARMGLRDLRIAPSSIFPVHEPLVSPFDAGVIRSVHTAYASGPVADAIGRGALRVPAVLQSHGGRARAIESGELMIDVAFIAAPACDDYGNINGISGPNACGTPGYAMVDARYARRVVAVTDHPVKLSLAVARFVEDAMRRCRVKGSFASGGITATIRKSWIRYER